MRSFTFVSLLLAATQVFASPTPTTVSIQARDVQPFSTESEIIGSHYDSAGSISRKIRSVLSNAERFARGLPPATPKRGHTGAKRAGSSPLPQITKRGIIQVTNTANGAVLGFISKNSFSGSQYRYQPDEVDAQIVTFNVDVGATSASSIDITSTNGDTGFPFLGLVQGRDNTNSNIAPGSFHYGYFAGTNQSPPGSTPSNAGNSYTTVTGTSRTSESAVWSFDSVSGALTVQWVNEDGSKPNTQTFTQSTALYFGGDSAAFAARYPAPVTSISYQFLERP